VDLRLLRLGVLPLRVVGDSSIAVVVAPGELLHLRLGLVPTVCSASRLCVGVGFDWFGGWIRVI
jgi:hypothetical protein